jgi:hypothetical protein
MYFGHTRLAASTQSKLELQDNAPVGKQFMVVAAE